MMGTMMMLMTVVGGNADDVSDDDYVRLTAISGTVALRAPVRKRFPNRYDSDVQV